MRFLQIKGIAIEISNWFCRKRPALKGYYCSRWTPRWSKKTGANGWDEVTLSCRPIKHLLGTVMGQAGVPPVICPFTG